MQRYHAQKEAENQRISALIYVSNNIGMYGDIAFSTSGFYSQSASSLFMKASGPLCKLNLMNFLFVIHESPP